MTTLKVLVNGYNQGDREPRGAAILRMVRRELDPYQSKPGEKKYFVGNLRYLNDWVEVLPKKGRYGATWERGELIDMLRLFFQPVPLREISRRLGRPSSGVRSKLICMGLLTSPTHSNGWLFDPSPRCYPSRIVKGSLGKLNEEDVINLLRDWGLCLLPTNVFRVPCSTQQEQRHGWYEQAYDPRHELTSRLNRYKLFLTRRKNGRRHKRPKKSL